MLGIDEVIIYRLWPKNTYLGNSAGADCVTSKTLLKQLLLLKFPVSRALSDFLITSNKHSGKIELRYGAVLSITSKICKILILGSGGPLRNVTSPRSVAPFSGRRQISLRNSPEIVSPTNCLVIYIYILGGLG